MTYKSPGLLKVYGWFRLILGPRSEAAGLGIQFDYDQAPGVHFKTQPPEQYRDHIVKGILDGLALRFPELLSTGSISIIEITADPVNSSQRAFYRAALMAIDQAFSLVQSRNETVSPEKPPRNTERGESS
jgi:hypothetical protein